MKLMTLFLILYAAMAMASETIEDAAAQDRKSAPTATALRCEDLDKPLDITLTQPRLTWQVVDASREGP